jgi:hypothetical protein
MPSRNAVIIEEFARASHVPTCAMRDSARAVELARRARRGR